MYARDELFMGSLECYFGVYLIINTKLTFSWAHKEFTTRVHTWFYISHYRRWNQHASCYGIVCVWNYLTSKTYYTTDLSQLAPRPRIYNYMKILCDDRQVHWNTIRWHLINIGKDCGLLPVGTKSLPGPMLINHQLQHLSMSLIRHELYWSCVPKQY